MFLAIIITLVLLCIIAERYIFIKRIAPIGRRARVIYISTSALGLLPYGIVTIIGRINPDPSATMSHIGTIALLLLLINILCKLPYGLALWHSNMSGKRWPLRVAYTLSALFVLLLLYGTLWERHQLRTTEVTIYYDNLPESADGLRIVQIGDLHVGNTSTRRKVLNKMVAEINRIQPDLVLDCGDMTNVRYTELSPETMDILSKVTAPLGVYTVLGNHDRGDYISPCAELTPEENRAGLIERQSAMGWHNITDSTRVIRIGKDSIFLTAINYPEDLKKGSHGGGTQEDYSPRFESIPQDAFNIVIAHTPAVWESILEATDAELTLSGHVHAMQLRIPIGPRGWSPSALVYDHWSGLYEKGNNRLFVTDGIGGGAPMRVGVKPQVVVITLKKK